MVNRLSGTLLLSLSVLTFLPTLSGSYYIIYRSMVTMQNIQEQSYSRYYYHRLAEAKTRVLGNLKHYVARILKKRGGGGKIRLLSTVSK